MKVVSLVILLILVSCASHQKPDAPKNNLSDFKKRLTELEMGCHKKDFISCGKFIKLHAVLNGSEAAVKSADDRCKNGDENFCYLKGYVQFYTGSVSEGYHTLSKACDKNIARACYFLGVTEASRDHSSHDSIPKNIQKACDLGLKRACAEMYYRKDFKYDLAETKAKKLLEKYDINDPVDLWDLTHYFQRVYEGNSNLALQYLKPACDQGIMDACWYLENYRLSDRELKERFGPLASEYCEKNSGRACFNVCRLHSEKNDTEKAINDCHKGCTLESSESCQEMAMLLERNGFASSGELYYKIDCTAHANTLSCNQYGYLTELKDLKTARGYFEITCQNGDEYGCRSLAGISAIEKDKMKARSYADLACKYEGPNACVSIGMEFYIQKKFKEAKVYFKRACDLKSVEGCFGLCSLAAQDGNKKKATRNLVRACSYSDSPACAGFKDIRSLNLSGKELKSTCELNQERPWSYWLKAIYSSHNPVKLLDPE